jgi:hypothetical protein
MVNYKFSDEQCDYIIKYFQSLLHEYTGSGRKYKRLTIKKDDKQYEWLWNDVDTLIKENLGKDHLLTMWILVLRYDVGDYFLPHTDGVYVGENDRYLSGGVELSKKSDFDGGDFIFENKLLEFNRGSLITHGLDELHEITTVTRGTRWSIHFGINNKIREKSMI